MSYVSKKRHEYTLFWMNLWTGLVFVLGAAVVAFLVFCIYLLTQGQVLEGAISAIGSLVSGGGFAWVVSRRRDAVAEEKLAYEDLGEAKRLTDVRERQKASRVAMFGAKNTSGEAQEHDERR